MAIYIWFSGSTWCRYWSKDITHGFDTQNYPKLQAFLGTQPKNTHGIQAQTQPISIVFFG